MKNILVSTVAAVAVLAFAGCAPKTSCASAASAPVNHAPKKVEPVVASSTVATTPVAAPVAAPAPAPVVVEPMAEPVPVMDAKEAAVQ